MRRMIKAWAVVWLVWSVPAGAVIVGMLPFSQPASAREQSNQISRQEVKAGLANQSIILVDVREPDEFKSGHIPGAQSTPLSSFDPSTLPKAAGKTVVLYCHSGRRAGLALAKAKEAGRGDIQVYSGSMLDWQAAGEPIEK
jgi:rhodanese-related sulfurtransferase